MTPEWEIERGLDYTAIVVKKESSTVWIAQVCEPESYCSPDMGVSFPSMAEAEANARLIAAAPEMREALIALYSGPCSATDEPERSRVNMNVSSEAFKKMEAALRKAAPEFLSGR